MNTLPATEKQIGFAKKLMSERDYTTLQVDNIHVKVESGLTKIEASTLISLLMDCPRRKEGVAALDEGIYVFEGDLFKVVTSKSSSARYAKKLSIESGRFEYAPGAIKNLLKTKAVKLSLEEAKRFGKAHGVCAVCGAELTDPKSVEAGIGPVCAGKF